jgi:hypothetical protein
MYVWGVGVWAWVGCTLTTPTIIERRNREARTKPRVLFIALLMHERVEEFIKWCILVYTGFRRCSAPSPLFLSIKVILRAVFTRVIRYCPQAFYWL